MKVANIIVFDIETGGFLTDDHKYGIAEIAMVAIDTETLKEIGRYEALIKPYKTHSGELTQYTDGAFAVNGLSMEKLETGKDALVVAKEIVKFANDVKVGGRNGQAVLAGHNIDGFDLPYLGQFFELMKIDASKNFSKNSIDTLLWSRLVWTKDGSILDHKLGTVCSAAGIELIDAHRAMVDVEATAELVKLFIGNMRGGGTSTEKKEELVSSGRKYRETFKF